MRTAMTEGQAVDALAVHFGLDAPVAFETVKKKYRVECKRLHPDHGGLEEDFKALNNAFDGLKQLYGSGSRLFDAEAEDDPIAGQEKVVKMPRQTVNGIPLSELGLGLGPTRNGKDCDRCEHRGYSVVTEHRRANCPHCRGSGRKPGRATSFYAFSFRGDPCGHCDGSGRVGEPVITRIYALECGSCHGTGEIEIYNPVLPKSRLSFIAK